MSPNQCLHLLFGARAGRQFPSRRTPVAPHRPLPKIWLWCPLLNPIACGEEFAMFPSPALLWPTSTETPPAITVLPPRLRRRSSAPTPWHKLLFHRPERGGARFVNTPVVRGPWYFPFHRHSVSNPPHRLRDSVTFTFPWPAGRSIFVDRRSCIV